jgi:hypothetical protein
MNIDTSLDQIVVDKINIIQQQTNQDIKQIIQTAIDLYYQKIQQPENDPLALLKQSDFIACGESNFDFSSTYKTQLKTILE